MFAKTWASIASGESHMCLSRPYFEVWKAFPQHESKISSDNENVNPDQIKTRPITKWFMFSKENCDALRSRLCSEYNGKKPPSPDMVLSAFIWSRIKFAYKNGVENIPHVVFHSVNIRPNVKALSESSYYFGNMLVSAIAEPRQHGYKSLSDGYLESVEMSIEKIVGKSGRFIEELKYGMRDLGFMKEHFERTRKGEIMSLGFASLRSLPVYEPDFGWGKPVWVTSARLVFKGLVILIPASPSSHDTYAYVNLSPDQMTILEQDHDFLSFVSKPATTFVVSNM